MVSRSYVWPLVVMLMVAAFAVAAWAQNRVAHDALEKHDRNDKEALTVALIASCERGNEIRRAIKLEVVDCEAVVRAQLDGFNRGGNP